MDAVRANQDIATRGIGVRSAAVEEISGNARLVLGERTESAAGADRVAAKPLDHGLMNYALQAAAMDGELRYVVTGIKPALFVPDLLSVACQIEQLISADGGIVEPVQQTDTG
jgi:hypothetical protein